MKKGLTMIEFISKLIELLEKLNTYFQKKYPKDTGIIVPIGARRSQLTRFWSDVSASLIIILSIVLLLITGLRIWLLYNYYVFLYKLNSNINANFANVFGEIKTILSFSALAVISFLLYELFTKRKRLSFREVLLPLAIVIIGGLTITSHFEKKVENYIKAEAYYLAFRKFENLEFESARDVFTALERGSMGEDVGVDVRRVLAESNLNTGNVKESIIGLTALIAQGGYNETSGEVLLLHTAIYALGKSMPLDDAMRFIDDLKTRYDVKELSPIWLGIDPQNNLHFIWDYVASFEAQPADRMVLRILISKYPSDYYVDLARFAIGEYQYVTDNRPASIFRDWCVYKSAQTAYRKENYDTAIQYYTQFLQEFPNHRWTDDAVLLLAKSYEQNGHPEYALDLLLSKDYFPDGDRMESIRAYRIALIDYYYDSHELRELILQYQHTRGTSQLYLPTFEYSLAEQLFRERSFEEAKQEFLKVEANYPGTVFSQYAAHNIEILTRIVEIKNTADGNWPIEVARLVMAPYDSAGDYDEYDKTTHLVIYNDLYEGRRLRGLSSIKWSDLTLAYHYQANDYLWAESLLEMECGACSNPDEVLYLRLLAYYNLTYPIAFIPSEAWVLERLDQIATSLLNEFPNSPYTPEALSLNAIGHANRMDFEGAAQLMLTLVNLYPNHTLANNAAIYSARSYRKLASETEDPTLKALYYAMAKKTYEMTIEKYPSGHVGSEAMEELVELTFEMK